LPPINGMPKFSCPQITASAWSGSPTLSINQDFRDYICFGFISIRINSVDRWERCIKCLFYVFQEANTIGLHQILLHHNNSDSMQQRSNNAVRSAVQPGSAVHQ
jgi:hypothetical protein